MRHLLFLGFFLVASTGLCAAQGNTITVWDSKDNNTKSMEMGVPHYDPATGLKAMVETEKTRLEVGIAKVGRDMLMVADPEKKVRLKIILNELERRLGILNQNPNKYFAKYPYKTPSPGQ